MSSRRLPLAAALALTGFLVACGADVPDRAEDTAPAPSSPAPTSPEATMPSSTPSPSPPGPVTIAVADLAERLGIEPDDVEVVSTEEVTWRNGSRGCAEPGTMYTQSLIDGTRITLGAGGATYEYHSGGSSPPALCENPTE